MSDSRFPTVAITGGSGFIGRRLVSELRAKGVNLRLLVRQRGEFPLGATIVAGDLRDQVSLQNLVRGADAVVHMAGVAHTTLNTPEDRAHAKEVNVCGTVSLLEAALAEGVGRIVVASSAHVYRGQKGTNIAETNPTAGDSPYAQMKLEAEAAAHAASAAGADVIIVRPCLTYGPGVRANLAALMNALRRRRYVHAYMESPLRSMASVDTVAGAMAHLLRCGKAGATYNVADRTPVRLCDWVDSLADRMGVSRPRTVPLWLLQSAAAAMKPASLIGIPVPLTFEALRKLSTSFSLDVTALAETGFSWPDTLDTVLAEMVRHQD